MFNLAAGDSASVSDAEETPSECWSQSAISEARMARPNHWTHCRVCRLMVSRAGWEAHLKHNHHMKAAAKMQMPDRKEDWHSCQGDDQASEAGSLAPPAWPPGR